MEMNPAQMSVLAQNIATMLVSILTEPAEAANKAAATGQRRIAKAVRAKVKALRMHNGGTLATHDPTWKLIDDGIVDANGNLIADANAVEGTTKVVAKPTQTLTKTDIKAMDRLRRKGVTFA